MTIRNFLKTKRGIHTGLIIRCINPMAESATGWRINRRRNFTGNDNPLSLGTWIRNRYRGDQSLGVCVKRVCIKFFRRSNLYDFAQIHNGDDADTCLTTAKS